MPYLICDECEVYYEIDSDFNINDLNTCEKCSRDLRYYHDFDEYYKEKDPAFIYEKEADLDKSYEHSTYNKTTLIGFILAITGLFIFMLAYLWPFFAASQNTPNFGNPDTTLNLAIQLILIYCISFIFMVAGVLIYIYSKRKENKNTTRGRKSINKSRSESGAADYFKKLPEGHFILNNLKIPGKRIKIDRVVVGPTGIFLIHIKNLHGHYIINGNEWMNDKGKIAAKALGNPSQQVKLNAIELKRFLESKNLNIDYILINSVVAFTHKNFTVRKMPRTYSVIHVEEMPNFIVNSKTNMDMGTVTEAVVLLERYSGGVVRS